MLGRYRKSALRLDVASEKQTRSSNTGIVRCGRDVLLRVDPDHQDDRPGRRLAAEATRGQLTLEEPISTFTNFHFH